MPKAYTFCRNCDHVVEDTRKRHPQQWLCSRFPRVEGGGFVDPEKWVTDEPFMRCKDINGGNCPLFTPIPEPKDEFQRQTVHRSNFEHNKKAEGCSRGRSKEK